MRIIASTSFQQGDLDGALGRIADMGFDGVDLIAIESWGHVSPEALVSDLDAECARVEGLLKKHGLAAVRCNAAFSPDLHDRESAEGNEKRRERVRAVCRFLRRFNIPVASHYPGHIADWKDDPEGVWRRTITSLEEIQLVAAEERVRLAPEIHYQTPFEAPKNARRLLQEIPGIPITYEPSHFLINGHSVIETADLMEIAVNIHMRTCGEGMLQADIPHGLDQLDWMVHRLKECRYEGTISIEYLPDADFDTEAAMRTLKERYES